MAVELRIPMGSSVTSTVPAGKLFRSPILLSFASLALTFVSLEIAARVVHSIHHRGEKSGVFFGANPTSRLLHQASSIPGLDYEMAPNRQMQIDGIPIQTNQYGMRDDERFEQHTISPCRIAAIGDSYTFGQGVRVEQSYPKALETLLRQSPAGAACKFEVLNFGVMGYSSYDEALMLKYRVSNFDPRVVIIGYVLNDPEIDPVQPIHAYFARKAWWQSSRLLNLTAAWMDLIRNDWDRKRLGGGDYYIYLHAPEERKWQSVVNAFSNLHEVASQRNFKVLVAIFPELTKSFKGKPWKDYPYDAIHKQVAGLALRNGFHVVDLRQAFSEYPSQDVVFPGIDDHPNVLGHEVAARAIEKELLVRGTYYFNLPPEQLTRALANRCGSYSNIEASCVRNGDTYSW